MNEINIFLLTWEKEMDGMKPEVFEMEGKIYCYLQVVSQKKTISHLCSFVIKQISLLTDLSQLGLRLTQSQTRESIGNCMYDLGQLEKN